MRRSICIGAALAAGLGFGTPQGLASDRDVPELRIALSQYGGELTPTTFTANAGVLTLVYDTLTWRDREGIPQPWLARAIEVDGTGRRVNVTLRAADWHDGVPVTARDVAFTYEFFSERASHARFSPQLDAIEQVEVIDESTVAFTLSKPSPGLEDQPFADVPILPEHIWRDLAPGHAAPNGLPIGSGPYRLIEQDPESGYRLEAYADYFLGSPKVPALALEPFDVKTTKQGLRSGRIDMTPSLPIAGDEDLETRGSEASYTGFALVFNTRRPPFDRAAKRRAVAQAIDLSRVADATGLDVEVASRGYLHPLSPWAPTAPVEAPSDSAPAAAAIESVRGVRLLAADQPYALAAAEDIAKQLGDAGTDVTDEGVPSEALLAAVSPATGEPDFDMAIMPTPPLASYDPDFMRALFGTGAGPLNFPGYQSEEFDAAAEKVASAPDFDARLEAVSTELEILARDAPVLPLFFPTLQYAFRDSAYDGWVSVRGSGILDKRSFLPARLSPSTSSVKPRQSPRSFPTLGLLAAGLLMGALLLVAAAMRRADR